ncbi:MAG: efflux RND transporter periplasmic adaptor subunit [Deltaproteobacteria bacterium]
MRLNSLYIWLIIALAATGLGGCGKKPAEPAAPPPVEVVRVLQQDVPVYHEYVGTTTGLVNAKVRAQVDGYLIKRTYREGSYVRKGQTLFEIDPRPFQAALEQAKGQLAQNQGNYYSAKTNLEKALPLAKLNAISRQDRDNAIGQARAAKAAVDAARAAVRRAQINLSFTKITSPITGIAGVATAEVGDLVGPATNSVLTTVSTLNPIKVYVPVSEQAYLEHVGAEQHHEINPQEFVFTMFLANGKKYPYKGRFYFLDRSVEVRTGTITVAVLFPNPGNVLRPGQFARVKVLTTILRGALLVPQKAVAELQGAYRVAVVSPAHQVEIRPVKVGERYGAWWVVSEGLKPGESVVAQGVQKIKAGEKVTPKLVTEKPPPKPETPGGIKPAPPTPTPAR